MKFQIVELFKAPKKSKLKRVDCVQCTCWDLKTYMLKKRSLVFQKRLREFVKGFSTATATQCRILKRKLITSVHNFQIPSFDTKLFNIHIVTSTCIFYPMTSIIDHIRMEL